MKRNLPQISSPSRNFHTSNIIGFVELKLEKAEYSTDILDLKKRVETFFILTNFRMFTNSTRDDGLRFD